MLIGLIFGYFAPCAQAYVDDLRRTPVVKAVQTTKGAVVNVSTYEQVYERTNPLALYPCSKATIREFIFCLASLNTPERFKE